MIDVDDPDAAIEFCDELLEDARTLPERAEDFATSIVEKVEDMKEWIEMNWRVTEGIANALENMRAGVDRWLNR
jgi:hypothetical protein